ncbi:hypothetical protein MTO96_024066, partial [Rhipicephalus appendiculatus]
MRAAPLWCLILGLLACSPCRGQTEPETAVGLVAHAVQK